ncbi:MAG: hypothetical protein SPH89_05650 [Candidatus Limisoma sp.]|nr:hypothetical protein [Candidatus Limisoma sp.]
MIGRSKPRPYVCPGMGGQYHRLVGRSKPRPYVIFSGDVFVPLTTNQ